MNPSKTSMERRLTIAMSEQVPTSLLSRRDVIDMSENSETFSAAPLRIAAAPAITVKLPELGGIRKKKSDETQADRLDGAFPAHLGYKLVGDAAVAVSVTGMIAPFLTVVDKALVQSSAGSHTILSSSFESIANMARQPVQYLKSPTFLWMWMTYAATYSAANALRTVTEHQEYLSSSSSATRNRAAYEKPAATGAGGMAAATLFVGTTAVNTTASLVKDRAYAKLFGSNQAAAVPKISYALWVTRDLTVIGSSFLLPPHVSSMIRNQQRNNGGNFMGRELSEKETLKLAQVGTPMAAQIIAGPLHFLGLDCYNRPLSSTTGSMSTCLDRCRAMTKNFVPVVSARMARILPGYGIAGVYNTQLRSQWREYLIRRQVEKASLVSNSSNISSNGIRDLVALIHTKKQH